MLYIKTQKELDNIDPINCTQQIVLSGTKEPITIKYKYYRPILLADGEFQLLGNARAKSVGGCKIIADDNSKLSCYADEVEAYGHAEIVAHAKSKVKAYDFARIEAWHESYTELYGMAVYYQRGLSKVKIDTKAYLGKAYFLNGSTLN